MLMTIHDQFEIIVVVEHIFKCLFVICTICLITRFKFRLRYFTCEKF